VTPALLRWLLRLALALVLGGCPDDDDDSAPGDDDDVTDDDDSSDDDDSGLDDDDDSAPVSASTTLTFAPTDAIFENPERGFYRTTSLVDGGWFYDGWTLSFSYIHLDEYRDTDLLPQSLLDDAQVGFDAARAAGVKIILRFAYNSGPYPDSEPDAPLARVLGHITQVTPLLEANADVIAVVQAGFIGAWGEWHTSTNDLLADKAEILEALLDAVPDERMVQIRTPTHKNDIYGNVPFPPADAHTGVDHARVGHHNDCFLASDSDFGTYPSGSVADWIGFTAAETLYTVHGGETCAPNPPRSECASAVAEMELLHTTYLNDEYRQEVLDSWITGGCRDEIDRRLGYRFELLAGSVTATSNGDAEVTLELVNVGWAALANPRTAWLVVDGATGAAVPLDVDPRFWLPGASITVTGSLSGVGPGAHALALWLPDAASGLQSDVRYAVRFANDGVWNDVTGTNDLGTLEVPSPN